MGAVPDADVARCVTLHWRILQVLGQSQTLVVSAQSRGASKKLSFIGGENKENMAFYDFLQEEHETRNLW